MTETSDFVRETLDELLEDQLRTDTPPAVRLTIERLVANGYSPAEALTLVGCALAREMYEALGAGTGLDARRYVLGLERLPALTWGDDA
jgi:hypothetical protein